ncbi:MAG: hypothetical protein HLUCCX10_05790 [Algoriphagus marincola HL-49]|uniref:Uncharacterized protein n=1 Tax=Algoriphagus marincola HL-49 TaxID=1305737 RepID=A0A0P7YCN9_9BACT|nr:MAG: hypothetical protein HLUCCX10_05790 [Algoriphagus marincola HL-49]
MKFIAFLILSLVLVLLVNGATSYIGAMAAVIVLGTLIHPGSFAAFFGGGFGMALAWTSLALYLKFSTGSDLPEKMGELFGVNSALAILLITAVIGFVLGAFSGLSGHLFWKMIRKKPNNIYRGNP